MGRVALQVITEGTELLEAPPSFCVCVCKRTY